MKLASYLLVMMFGVAVSHFFFQPNQTVQTEPVVPQRKFVRIANPSTGWPEVYMRLGIKEGDILKSVDSDPTPEDMLSRLVRGFNNGEVCAQFERDGQALHSCYSKRENLEKVAVDVRLQVETEEKQRSSPDLAEVMQTHDVEKELSEGKVPYIDANGEFLGFVSPDEIDVLPSDLQLGENITEVDVEIVETE